MDDVKKIYNDGFATSHEAGLSAVWHAAVAFAKKEFEAAKEVAEGVAEDFGLIEPESQGEDLGQHADPLPPPVSPTPTPDETPAASVDAFVTLPHADPAEGGDNA